MLYIKLSTSLPSHGRFLGNKMMLSGTACELLLMFLEVTASILLHP